MSKLDMQVTGHLTAESLYKMRDDIKAMQYVPTYKEERYCIGNDGLFQPVLPPEVLKAGEDVLQALAIRAHNGFDNNGLSYWTVVNALTDIYIAMSAADQHSHDNEILREADQIRAKRER